jgi:hypothetical protein
MLFVDLETLPTERPPLPPKEELGSIAAIEAAYSISDVGRAIWEDRDARLTDPVKVLANLDKVWHKTAVDPFLCRPLCMGFATNNEPIQIVVVGDVNDPTPILDAALEHGDELWCSHGAFDLEVLTVAALRTKHPLLERLPGGPTDRWASKWVNTQTGFSERFLSLATIARVLGMQKTASGADVLDMYLEGKIEEIIRYCVQDVNILRTYAQARGLGLPKASPATEDLFLTLAKRVGYSRAISRILEQPGAPSIEDFQAGWR